MGRTWMSEREVRRAAVIGNEGDTSIEAERGTFLSRLDTVNPVISQTGVPAPVHPPDPS